MLSFSQVERMERYGSYIFHEDYDWRGKQEMHGHQDQLVRVMMIIKASTFKVTAQ